MRILVADDHEAVRRGVCTILASRSEFEVCAARPRTGKRPYR